MIEGARKRDRKRDPAPRARPKESKTAKSATQNDGELTKMLAELLVVPAIPAALILDCDFCRDHFLTEGPKAARELVALSHGNPALRGALESMHGAWTKLTIAGVLAAYVAKPVMHHLAPAPMLAAVGPVLQVPPRPPKPKHSHDAPHAEYEGPETREPEYEGPAPADQYPGDPAAGIHAA